MFLKNSFPVLLILISLLINPAIMKAQNIDKGDKAPVFEAPASLDGKEFNFTLKEAITKGPVVLYFFPSAYTNGCDLQAATFSESSEEFKKAGATIVGISADDMDRLNSFSADPDFCAGNFPVASDPEGEIAKSFGLSFSPAREGALDNRGELINHGFIPRVTYVIDKKGTVQAILSSENDGISPDEHVKKSLEVVKSL